MNDIFIMATIKAELKRARRDRRSIDRRYLQRETGLNWDRLERRIYEAALEFFES